MVCRVVEVMEGGMRRDREIATSEPRVHGLNTASHARLARAQLRQDGYDARKHFMLQFTYKPS
jgi:hypothetical protein